MNETILTWNVPNWITVVLMAMLGFAVVGLIGNTIQKVKANETD